MTFPVGGSGRQLQRGPAPGDNLSLNFDVTSGAAGQTRRDGGDGQRPGGHASATITGVQPLAGAQPVQAAGVPGAVSPIAQNTASINAPGLAGTPGATTGVQQGGVQQGWRPASRRPAEPASNRVAVSRSAGPVTTGGQIVGGPVAGPSSPS